MTHDIAAMETKLRTIEKGLGTLADGRHIQQLIPIVRRPGFTTLAEAMLIHAMLDQVQYHTEVLQRSCEALLAAAEKVGTS
jgi:hypothetical protein